MNKEIDIQQRRKARNLSNRNNNLRKFKRVQMLEHSLSNVFPIQNKKSRKTNSEKTNFILKAIYPLTATQKLTFKEYNGNNLFIHGYAGTGKSFLLLYLALNQILNENSPYKKLIIMRSIVPTRDIGFLPGKVNGERTKVYESPYYNIFSKLFGRGDAYDILKNKGLVEFMTTSFVRSLTLENVILVADEVQNFTFHELDSVITRIGENSKILFSGDFKQSDFTKEADKSGIQNFMKIIKGMNGHFKFIEYGKNDIVRSELVKDYIITKERLTSLN